MATVRVGDLSTTIQLTCQENSAALDVSAATTRTIKIKRPDTSVVSLAATNVNDGTDGIISGTTDATTSDFNAPGIYTVFAYLVIGSWKGHTDAVELTVEAQGA